MLLISKREKKVVVCRVWAKWKFGKSQQRALFFGKCPVGRAFGQKMAKSGRSRKMGVKLYRWEAGAKSSTIGDKGLIFGTEVARARK